MLRETADKELRKELYAGINRAVKPLTVTLKGSTRQFLPDRYAAELSRSLRVRTNRRAGRNPRVRLVGSAKTPSGKERNLTALNRGVLRHPLYGDRRYWFDQSDGVRPMFWDKPLTDNADEVRQVLVHVLNDITRQIERKL